MGAYVWGVGLALVAAVCVLVAANAWGDDRIDVRSFLRDLRSGLRRDDDDAAGDDGAPPVDVHLDELFAREAEPDDGYLQLDELAELLERTGERAGRLLHTGHLPRPSGHVPRRPGRVPRQQNRSRDDAPV